MAAGSGTAPAAAAQKAPLSEVVKIPGGAKAVLKQVRSARLALFEGQPQAAKDLVAAARAGINDSLAKFAVKLGEKKGYGIPFDSSIEFSEQFKPTPEHRTVIAQAGQHIRQGNSADAVKMMSKAGIDLVVKLAVIPTGATVAKLDKAKTDIAEKRFYEANMALKSIESSIKVEAYNPAKLPKQGYPLKSIL